MSILPVPEKTKSTNVYKKDDLYVVTSCMQGWREYMEDAHCVLLAAPKDKKCAFFGVYDGHRGGSVAKYASKGLHHYIMSQPEYMEGNIQRAIYQGFIKFDKDMRSMKAVKREKAGSTACTILFKEGHIYCGNSGDTRAIALVGRSTIPLSSDHKPTVPEERARIVAAGGHVTNDRVNGELSVSRGFGDFKFKKNASLPPGAQILSCTPDVREWQIDESWKFIFIASDGIFENMTTEAVGDFINNQINDFKRPEKIIESLMDECCSKSSSGEVGFDNMTGILILFVKALLDEYKEAVLDREPSEEEILEGPKEASEEEILIEDPQPGPSKQAALKKETPRQKHH